MEPHAKSPGQGDGLTESSFCRGPEKRLRSATLTGLRILPPTIVASHLVFTCQPGLILLCVLLADIFLPVTIITVCHHRKDARGQGPPAFRSSSSNLEQPWSPSASVHP